MARIIVQADDGTQFESVKISAHAETYKSMDELIESLRLIVPALTKALAQDKGLDPRLY